MILDKNDLICACFNKYYSKFIKENKGYCISNAHIEGENIEMIAEDCYNRRKNIKLNIKVLIENYG